MKRVEVSAGLVFRHGKVLLTQRPAGGHLAGFWEFPGGKREAGESFEQCLQRELLEELGIEVEIGERIETLTHDYPGKSVYLEFFHCRWLRHEPRPLGCADLVWAGRDDLAHYTFPPADTRVLEQLASRAEWWT